MLGRVSIVSRRLARAGKLMQGVVPSAPLCKCRWTGAVAARPRTVPEAWGRECEASAPQGEVVTDWVGASPGRAKVKYRVPCHAIR